MLNQYGGLYLLFLLVASRLKKINGDVKLQVSEQKEHVAYEKLRKRLPTL